MNFDFGSVDFFFFPFDHGFWIPFSYRKSQRGYKKNFNRKLYFKDWSFDL